MILFENFDSKDTIRKHKEVYEEGEFLTSTVVICSEPPNNNISQDIVKRSILNGTSVGKLRTLFKVKLTS